MYLQFYRLNDHPFRLAPDPKYLFRTESMVEALANLQYGIETGKGLVVVTGEVGTGKTTTLRSHLMSLDRRVSAAYIFNPLLSTHEFFDTLLTEFKVRPQSSKSGTLRAIGYLLLARHRSGLRTALVIDEAHLLPPHLLEEIRLLSNFETNRDKLLQIVLCGQPELLDLLEQPEMRQLKQRITLRCAIEPMSARQTTEYIRWRLRIAGSRHDKLFKPDAIAMIHEVSTGIPRVVNNICDNALLVGFSSEASCITETIVNQVVEMLGLASPSVSADAEPWATGISTGTQLTPPVGVSSPVTTSGFDNVHYLNQQSGVAPAAYDCQYGDSVRFTIEFDRNDRVAAPGRFFSKVRVSRR
ncbi:MAG TPA: AAA family ATPase [Blastocatellia bacterium]